MIPFLATSIAYLLIGYLVVSYKLKAFLKVKAGEYQWGLWEALAVLSWPLIILDLVYLEEDV